MFVGTQRGLESRLVPEAGLPLETIRSAGLKGMGRCAWRATFCKLAPGDVGFCRDSSPPSDFAAAFGVGGYAAGPVMMLAAMARTAHASCLSPTPSPASPTALLAMLVTRIATGYPAVAESLGRRAPGSPGCPVRPEFFCDPAQPARAALPLLITGGSQGARVINRAVVDAARLLGRIDIPLSIVHQTGERDYNEVRSGL